MNTLRNEIEEKGWRSIDTLIGLLDEVIQKHSQVVEVDDIEAYCDALMKTVYRHAREEQNV